MLTKRIIPCLDIKDGRVVKGTNFVQLRDAGDPVELAKTYNDQSADELVFLDITATHEARKTVVELAERVARNVFIPFTIGGGISTTEQMQALLIAGADKISVNSAAIKNPQLISDGANWFGNQCIVLAIDARRNGNSWEVYTHGGRTATGINAIEWAKEGVKRGAGEILLTSMDRDGTKDGYDVELTRTIAKAVPVPVIASGGAGKLEDFATVLSSETEGGMADAALAASLFHFQETSIAKVKEYLAIQNIPVRLIQQ